MDSPDPTHYLTPAEIYDAAQEATGRKPEVRERHLLRSAAARPMLRAFGSEAYPTLMEKAAALMHSLAAHHLFWDGNKRTATRATLMFLEKNGLQPDWDADTIYQYVLEIAQNKHDVPEIAIWLEAHTKPLLRYITVDELIYINQQVAVSDEKIHTIVEGKRAVRDIGLLEAAAARPASSAFGQDAFATLPEKAAVLLHAIARNHPFADGNKRTATVAALFLLAVNGWRVTWQAAEALSRIVAMAEGKTDVADFAVWLPLEPGQPASGAKAAHDMQIIARLIAEHHWLLTALAER